MTSSLPVIPTHMKIRNIQKDIRLYIVNHQILYERSLTRPQDLRVKQLMSVYQHLLLSLGRAQEELIFQFKEEIRTKHGEDNLDEIIARYLSWPDRHLINSSPRDERKTKVPIGAELVKKSPTLVQRPGSKMKSVLKLRTERASQQQSAPLVRKESERLKAAAATRTAEAAEAAANNVKQLQSLMKSRQSVVKPGGGMTLLRNRIADERSPTPGDMKIPDEQPGGLTLAVCGKLLDDAIVNSAELSQDIFLLGTVGLLHKDRLQEVVVRQGRRKRRTLAGQSSYYNDYHQPKKRSWKRKAAAANSSDSSEDSDDSDSVSDDQRSQESTCSPMKPDLLPKIVLEPMTDQAVQQLTGKSVDSDNASETSSKSSEKAVDPSRTADTLKSESKKLISTDNELSESADKLNRGESAESISFDGRSAGAIAKSGSAESVNGAVGTLVAETSDVAAESPDIAAESIGVPGEAVPAVPNGVTAEIMNAAYDSLGVETAEIALQSVEIASQSNDAAKSTSAEIPGASTESADGSRIADSLAGSADESISHPVGAGDALESADTLAEPAALHKSALAGFAADARPKPNDSEDRSGGDRFIEERISSANETLPNPTDSAIQDDNVDGIVDIPDNPRSAPDSIGDVPQLSQLEVTAISEEIDLSSDEEHERLAVENQPINVDEDLSLEKLIDEVSESDNSNGSNVQTGFVGQINDDSLEKLIDEDTCDFESDEDVSTTDRQDTQCSKTSDEVETDYSADRKSEEVGREIAEETNESSNSAFSRNKSDDDSPRCVDCVDEDTIVCSSCGEVYSKKSGPADCPICETGPCTEDSGCPAQPESDRAWKGWCPKCVALRQDLVNEFEKCRVNLNKTEIGSSSMPPNFDDRLDNIEPNVEFDG